MFYENAFLRYYAIENGLKATLLLFILVTSETIYHSTKCVMTDLPLCQDDPDLLKSLTWMTRAKHTPPKKSYDLSDKIKKSQYFFDGWDAFRIFMYIDLQSFLSSYHLC